jgi:hypothetical protein
LRRLLAIVQHPHYLHPLVVERFLWLRSRRWCIQPGKTTVLTCPASQFRITFHISTYHSALTSTWLIAPISIAPSILAPD